MKNAILSFIAVFVFTIVLNCSASKVNNQHYQREWMMFSFDQFTKQQLIENKAEINLTGKKTGDNKVKGFATMGCNRILFVAELQNSGKINISGIGSTKMACQNMALENTFMKKFGNMKNYLIKGHRLTLSDNAGNEMKFIAADWD